METNFFGPQRLVKAALPGFRTRKSGTIVNITTVAGIAGLPSCGYAASKVAVDGSSYPSLLWMRIDEKRVQLCEIGFLESLALETKPYNVNDLLVDVGTFRTNILSAHVLPMTLGNDYSPVNAVLQTCRDVAGNQ